MPDFEEYRQIIVARLTELGVRMHDIEAELDKPKPKDDEDRAIDLEDDEVLEGLGLAAQSEARQLQRALSRIEDGTFGICRECDNRISPERLIAVPYAMLCRNCATAAEARSRKA